MDNHDPAVDAWFETYDNPQKDLVQAVRRVILEADSRISETIKWQAPTFMYKGNLASFYPRSTKHVSLMFHTGASLPVTKRMSRSVNNPSSRRSTSTSS